MWKFCCVCMALALLWGTQAQAHFGMVIPSTPTITDKKESPLKLDIAFAHPMELQGMPMVEPKAFTVTHDGAAEDLKSLLKPATILGNKAWTASYTIKKPGVYQFAVEPQPYFEPAEDCYIIHYTKTVVAAFGEEEGWGQPLGLKTEIVPLTRPFANYSGNVFQGQVLLDGKPVPGAEVEIESYNKGKGHTAPNEFYVTQVVKADQNGVFTYGVPWAGWWGFAALNTAEEKMDHQGEAKSVELGAVIWVNFAAPRVK